jgi:nitrogen fixation NifU-like protein
MSKLIREEIELLRKSGYSPKAIEFYMDGLNVGRIQEPDVDLSYTGACGDAIRVYLRISNDGVITEAKFECLGCPAAVLSGSAVTKIAEGKTLKDAKEISEEDILHEIGGLPKTKLHCPKLAITTLQNAITKFEKHRRTSGYSTA